MAASITVAELKALIAEGTNIHVVDVRRQVDYEKMPMTIEGAAWHDPEKVEDWSKTLPNDHELVVYCVRGGSVSQSVATSLQKSLPGVRFLEGGLLGWQDAS